MLTFCLRPKRAVCMCVLNPTVCMLVCESTRTAPCRPRCFAPDRFVRLRCPLSSQIDVDGNKLTGDPRSFSSGNLGWYLTGKVEVDVGGETIWAQVGMNVTIPG
jgi:hypothetical protein